LSQSLHWEGMYKFNYLANHPGYDVDGIKIKGLHPSWDVNKYGVNDCEDDGSCDHTVDYSLPRKNNIRTSYLLSATTDLNYVWNQLICLKIKCQIGDNTFNR
jgi:hypothetical protein